MLIPDIKEKWTNRINVVKIGATDKEEGTRTSTVTVGGETTLPMLTFEGEIPYKPVIAGTVVDIVPDRWPECLRKAIGDVINSPAEWAQKLVEEDKVELISLHLYGADPTGHNRDADKCAEVVRNVLETVGVPLIIWGCGNDEKDNEIMPVCSNAAKGENCLLGSAREKNYKTMAAIAIADGHKLIGEAPVDINIAKQVNILLEDAGFSLQNIVMNQVTAALGYGFDYVYTIFERVRIAGLKGDKYMALPQLADVGWETWKVKEPTADEADLPAGYGSVELRSFRWEATTAIGYLNAGADIVTLAHPLSIKYVRWMRDIMF